MELSSASLPAPLLRNKERECTELAKKELANGRAQATVIYNHIYEFIHSNMFVPCWKELKQLLSLCEGKGQVKAYEKEGTIHMRVGVDSYKLNIILKVPPYYPEDGVVVEFGRSTFPEDILYVYKSQADEIVRRCVAGFSPEQAVCVSVVMKPATGKSQESNVRLTSDSLQNIKHDVGVLKQISDLRTVTSGKDKRNQSALHSTAERRDARKDLRRLAKAETAAEQELLEKQKEEEQREMQLLMGTKASETAQPSLLAVARFLVDELACGLPREPCQACRKPVLPPEPASETATGSAMKPMRTYCGHWLHYRCLNEWLTTPPFVRMCPVCQKRIWHPDWPEDYKVLERAWQNQEARKREMSDVSDFLDMGDFSISKS